MKKSLQWYFVASILGVLTAFATACSPTPSTPAASQATAVPTAVGVAPTKAGGVPTVASTPTGASSGTLGGELIIDTPTAIKNLDPQRTYLTTDASIQQSLFDPLVFRMPDESLAPGLAKSWERTSDTEWVVKLQEGVTFQNGEPFDAEAVKANIARIKDANIRDSLLLADPLKDAEVIDKYTVKIITNRVYPQLPQQLALLMMVPPKYATSIGKDEFQVKPIGSGPYKLVEWVKDTRVVLEANPNYWNKVRAPTFRRVVFNFLPTAGTRLAALRAGEADIVKEIPSDDFDAIKADPKFDALWVRSLRTPVFRFFPDSPQGGGKPFNDVKVRQAVNHAINVDAMLTTLLGGLAYRIATLMTPDFEGYDKSVLPYEYNPQKAKQLLAEAGYSGGFSINLEVPTTLVPKGVDIAQAAASDLGKVGITAKVMPLDVNTMLNNQKDRKLAPLHIWTWGGSRLDCWQKSWGVFHPDSVATFMTNKPVTDMIGQVDLELDAAKRAKICSDMQKQIHDDALIVPLFAQADTYAKKKTIDWKPRADELVFPWEAKLR